jgi:hypothetical protein
MVKELISKCGAMTIIAFNFIVNLNMPYLAIKVKTSNSKVSTPSTN